MDLKEKTCLKIHSTIIIIGSSPILFVFLKSL